MTLDRYPSIGSSSASTTGVMSSGGLEKWEINGALLAQTLNSKNVQE
jgi:hypothetical protein